MLANYMTIFVITSFVLWWIPYLRALNCVEFDENSNDVAFKRHLETKEIIDHNKKEVMLSSVALLCFVSFSTHVNGDAAVVAKTFKLPLKNCLYVAGDLKSVPQPSVAACAFQCARTDDCLCFWHHGARVWASNDAS